MRTVRHTPTQNFGESPLPPPVFFTSSSSPSSSSSSSSSSFSSSSPSPSLLFLLLSSPPPSSLLHLPFLLLFLLLYSCRQTHTHYIRHLSVQYFDELAEQAKIQKDENKYTAVLNTFALVIRTLPRAVGYVNRYGRVIKLISNFFKYYIVRIMEFY